MSGVKVSKEMFVSICDSGAASRTSLSYRNSRATSRTSLSHRNSRAAGNHASKARHILIRGGGITL